MIKMLFRLPKTITVALSGGVDSVAVVDFLSRNHKVNCVFFDHGTINSQKALEFVKKFCDERHLSLSVGGITEAKLKKESMEEYWRNQRYRFFESLNQYIVTAHNLDDCVETYLYSSIHGVPKIIPSRRNNIFRPFLTTSKSEFINWCQRKKIHWCEDQSNKNINYMRNYIRHNLVPHALIVNPGLSTVVKKIIEKQNLPL